MRYPIRRRLPAAAMGRRSRRAVRVALIILLVAPASGCGGDPSSSSSAASAPPHEFRVTPVANPAVDSAQVSRVVSGADGRVRMTWVERPETGPAVVKLSTMAGEKFGPAMVVASGDLFVNWADFPSCAVLADGTLAIHWLERFSGGGYGARVVCSKDDGRTFTKPRWLHTDRDGPEYGFVTLTPAGTEFRAVWLDSNAYRTRREMELRTAVVSSVGVVSDETVIDPRVCECCCTSGAVTSDGAVMTAYRDRSQVNVRDIVLARREKDGGVETALVHADDWVVPG